MSRLLTGDKTVMQIKTRVLLLVLTAAMNVSVAETHNQKGEAP